ncbi:ABC transporter ATP-binding protein/permease [Canibacter sp. lx-72]|uniref:ABC transporter ATP-binding protein n=1 Tax=Canibacter zhuwentaonis TaxID=2837491 RepID=UPI001BDBC9B8|nr:ABC transporter ATP-binding protein [Canibacter zhuwentaonis]MBT1018147.1 ABC transporter ATP-binding protein/permease [Canibacter zhuwentaonis]
MARKSARPDLLKASLRELLPYLFVQRKVLVLAIALGVIGAVVSLLQPLIMGEVIRRVQHEQALGLLIVALLLCVVGSALLSGFQHYLLQRMGEAVVLYSRRSLIRKLVFLPIPEFDRRRNGDLVSRIGSDTTLLRAVLTQGLVEALGGSLLLVGALIAMAVIDPALFASTIAVVVFGSLVVVMISLKMRPLVAQTQQQVGDLAASVDRTVSGIRTIRAAGAGEREAEVLYGQAEKAYFLGLRVAKLSALVVPVSFIALQLSFLVVLGLGGYRVAAGHITIAQLVSFIIFVFFLIVPLGQIFGAVAAVSQALGALGRIQEIIRLQTEPELDAINASTDIYSARSQVATEFVPQPVEPVATDALPDVTPTPAPLVARSPVPQQALQLDVWEAVNQMRSGETLIEFDDVYFTYRSAAPDRVDARKIVDRKAKNVYVPPKIVETAVLHGVSFTVKKGQRVAIVGPSGSGKSTVLNLIERFSDPDAGTIRFAGYDIRALQREHLRAQLGYVEQDAPVLAGSLRENLLLANPKASDAECERVLSEVNLGKLLDRSESIAEALNAEVGEHGIMLSGGEKQRLAIARALLAQTPVLLLDESTASLDGVNEAKMREAIDAVANDRTVLVVAHRLVTVVDSDLIIVIDGGRVIGSGTHHELIKNVPLYRDLAQRQHFAV